MPAAAAATCSNIFCLFFILILLPLLGSPSSAIYLQRASFYNVCLHWQCHLQKETATMVVFTLAPWAVPKQIGMFPFFHQIQGVKVSKAFLLTTTATFQQCQVWNMMMQLPLQLQTCYLVSFIFLYLSYFACFDRLVMLLVSFERLYLMLINSSKLSSFTLVPQVCYLSLENYSI